MIAPFPSPVAKWHDDTYPAIDPTRAELSHAGQTVIVTGGNQGIGQAIVEAYAAAGAAKVAILARREAMLTQVKQDIEKKFPKTIISCHVVDVIDRASLKKAAKEIGHWNVIVLNAGFRPDDNPMAVANDNDWWKGFEVNILGTFLSLQAFMPTKATAAAVVGISSGVISLPGSIMVNATAYQASKVGMTKMLETFGMENPDMHVSIIHPGIIDTEMMDKSGRKGMMKADTRELPGHFVVWSTSPEAAFTSGKFLWVNWDVEELISKKSEILEPHNLTVNILGWPWSSSKSTLK